MNEQPITDTEQTALTPEDVLELFKQQFPHVFSDDPQAIRPLKINIHLDLRELFAGKLSNRLIARALKLYAKHPVYVEKLQEGIPRIDLEGNPCGEVTAEHIAIGQEAQARHSRYYTQPKPQDIPLENPSDGPPISGRLEVNIKIYQLPEEVRTTKNGWQEFVVEVEKRPIKVTLRPKSWKKLIKASTEFSYWVASIKGKMGKKLKFGGFELLEPAIQIYERKSKKTSAENKD